MEVRMIVGACALISLVACQPTSTNDSPETDAGAPDAPIVTAPAQPEVLNVVLPHQVQPGEWALGAGASAAANEGETYTVTFAPGSGAPGFVYVRIPTEPGVSYIWSGQIRAPGVEAPVTTSIAAYDDEFERQPIEIDSEWRPFSMEIETGMSVTHFYIDNRVEGASAAEIEVEGATISVAPVEVEDAEAGGVLQE